MGKLARLFGILALAGIVLTGVALAGWGGQPAAASAAVQRVAAQPVPAPRPSIDRTSVVRTSDISRADVNDFEFDSFHADFALGRDDEGRSTLATTETLVAVFPDYNQNRGIIREIPRVYDGHPTDIDLLSVTDESGEARPYTAKKHGDYLVVTIAVPEGSYVHGRQSYVLEYTQRDVTRYFEDTAADEFYWDINGTGWSQPFGTVSARIALDDGLEKSLDGNTSCYRGYFGSTERCELTVDGATIRVSEQDIWARQNVTIAVGFAPGTFAERPFNLVDRFPPLVLGGFGCGIAAVALTIITLIRGGRGAKTGRAIIAQYEPPDNTSAALSAELMKARQKAMTATLLDLAVRRKIRLLYDEPTGQYGAQRLSDEGLLPIEQTVFTRIFGGFGGFGGISGSANTVWFDRRSTALGDTAAEVKRRARTEAVELGLVAKNRASVLWIIILLFVLALGLPVLYSILVGDDLLMTLLLAVGINVLVWLLIGVAALILKQRRRTEQGALLRDHLLGLREYIRLAEADRIRVLQSVSGAEVDENRIVQIYERLLPYAVIFGYEKEWQAELARHYRESTPDWVGSSSGASFVYALPLTGFSSYVATSPTTQSSSSSSSSSSSGGSSGGGSSGGGGGGGGGGGI
ncbi:MAG: DUF2207 domain-containing protein [Leucobacter sp.]